ncbi:MAG: hypothetical protein AAFW74_01300 [Pseudomonadota bacterium]
MYLRFVIQSKHPHTGVEEGLFRPAYALRRSGKLPQYEYAELDKLLKWFGENLQVPTRFNRTKSKGYYRRNSRGISWLKPTSLQCISKMRALAVIMSWHGYHTTMIKTARPGYVVYEDDHQIVAEPFSDAQDLH